MRARAIALTVAGFAAGFVVGLLATVVHPGPVDMPVVGLALSCAIVACGSWFMLESGWVRAWLGAVVGVAAAAIWLLMAPPGDDSFISVSGWVSNVWLFLAPMSAVVPALWASKGGIPNEK
ncbi:MAG: hypothetical protein Q3979_03745 [Actinomycetaceae bacterium]|nr:hypothetical protein [Actinomycetaceae bacterium]